MRCDALAANRDSAKKKFGYKSANKLGREDRGNYAVNESERFDVA